MFDSIDNYCTILSLSCNINKNNTHLTTIKTSIIVNSSIEIIKFVCVVIYIKYCNSIYNGAWLRFMKRKKSIYSINYQHSNLCNDWILRTITPCCHRLNDTERVVSETWTDHYVPGESSCFRYNTFWVYSPVDLGRDPYNLPQHTTWEPNRLFSKLWVQRDVWILHSWNQNDDFALWRRCTDGRRTHICRDRYDESFHDTPMSCWFDSWALRSGDLR